MRPDEHQRMYELEDSYWWFVGRRDILRAILRRFASPGDGLQILDVGCGTGANLVLLSAYGQVTGVDAYNSALEFCRKRGFTNVRQARVEELDLETGQFDLVTAIELLEHLEDDGQGLRECLRVTRPGGRMLITVPAYQFLWSDHDEALDHMRRYSKRTLLERVRQAGFQVERATFCITFLLPVIVAFRLAQRLTGLLRRRRSAQPRSALIQMPGPINRFFIWLLRIEARILKLCDLPCGVTLVCVARRPEYTEGQNDHTPSAS